MPATEGHGPYLPSLAWLPGLEDDRTGLPATHPTASFQFTETNGVTDLPTRLPPCSDPTVAFSGRPMTRAGHAGEDGWGG